MDLEHLIKNTPFSRSVKILATHPQGLIALDKKSGVLSHPNKKNKNEKKYLKNKISSEEKIILKSKYNLEKEYFSWVNKDGQKTRLWLLNRLDSPTSGVILLSYNEELAEKVKELFKKEKANKIYYSINIGSPLPSFGIWSDSIKKTILTNTVRASNDIFGSKASTSYKKIKSDPNSLGLSLIELKPKTGKTHQLRVQSQIHNFPILGDASYGNFAFNKKFFNCDKNIAKRLYLHCGLTHLVFDFNGQVIDFLAESPLPRSFDKILKTNNALRKNFLEVNKNVFIRS